MRVHWRVTSRTWQQPSQRWRQASPSLPWRLCHTPALLLPPRHRQWSASLRQQTATLVLVPVLVRVLPLLMSLALVLALEMALLMLLALEPLRLERARPQQSE